MSTFTLEDFEKKWNNKWSTFLKEKRLLLLSFTSPKVYWFFSDISITPFSLKPLQPGFNFVYEKSTYLLCVSYHTGHYPFSLPAYFFLKENEGKGLPSKEFFNLSDTQDAFLKSVLNEFPFSSLLKDFYRLSLIKETL